MTKRQLIDEILAINRSANPRFLAEFDPCELSEYLAHLLAIREPRTQGGPWWPEKHVKGRPAAPASTSADAEEALPQARGNPHAAAEELGEAEGDIFLDDALPESAEPAVVAATSHAGRRTAGRPGSRTAKTSGKWLF